VTITTDQDFIKMLKAANNRLTCEINNLRNGTSCLWWQDETDDEGTSWYTDCGEEFILLEGTPETNAMNYCPYCGARLTQHAPDKSEDSDDERALSEPSISPAQDGEQ
jgi:hypothetical protein